MVLTWRSQILIIIMIRHHQVKPYLRRPQIHKQVEIIKVSEIPTYDTSFERSRLGDHRF